MAAILAKKLGMTQVFQEDGLTRGDKETYAQMSGTHDSIQIQAYEFGDATGAFAAYTYLRKPTDRPVTGSHLGKEAVEDGDAVLLWDGRTVVVAEFHGERRIADLQDLIPVLPKIGGPKGLAPMLPTLLIPSRICAPLSSFTVCSITRSL